MALEPYPKNMCSEQEYDFQENLLKALLNLRALQDCSRTSLRMLQGGGGSGVAKHLWTMRLFQFEHHGLGTLATSSGGFQSI